MSATYPKPATPLPWPEERYAGICGSFSIADTAYVLRAANAFPHLVGALEALQLQALQSDVNDSANEWGREALSITTHALAIARGEATP